MKNLALGLLLTVGTATSVFAGKIEEKEVIKSVSMEKDCITYQLKSLCNPNVTDYDTICYGGNTGVTIQQAQQCMIENMDMYHEAACRKVKSELIQDIN